MKEVPKSDPFLVLSGLVLLVFIVSYAVQWQKYISVMDKIKAATINNLNIKNGGSEETQEFYKIAISRYEEKYLNTKSKHGKVKITKISKDPFFKAVVDEVISENIKGTLWEIFISYYYFSLRIKVLFAINASLDIVKPSIGSVLSAPFCIITSSYWKKEV